MRFITAPRAGLLLVIMFALALYASLNSSDDSERIISELLLAEDAVLIKHEAELLKVLPRAAGSGPASPDDPATMLCLRILSYHTIPGTRTCKSTKGRSAREFCRWVRDCVVEPLGPRHSHDR